MNKAGYIALVNENLPDEGIVTPELHRATMHTVSNSIGDLVYSDSIDETKATESILTTSSTNLTFIASIYKVGRNVTITGRITNEGSTFLAPSINITSDDYKPKEDLTFYGSGVISNSSEGINVSVINITEVLPSCRINFGSILGSNESINFTISYPANT